MPHFCKQQIKAAKKPHRCTWCGELIKKGEPYEKQVGTHDGDFYTNKIHPECVEGMNDVDWRDYDYEFEPCSHLRGTSKHIDTLDEDGRKQMSDGNEAASRAIKAYKQEQNNGGHTPTNR
jgi:hypothetical protein